MNTLLYIFAKLLLLFNLLNKTQAGVTVQGEPYECLNKEDYPRFDVIMQGIDRQPFEVPKNIWCKTKKTNHIGMEKMYLQKTCGTFKASNYKVAGGAEVDLMSRPWMALLHDPNQAEAGRCGGSLITERFVLTAAHCLEGWPERRRLRVRLGEHNLTSNPDCSFHTVESTCVTSEEFDIEKVYRHEDYSYAQSLHDIALVKLNMSVEYKDHIKPICLPLTRNLQRTPFDWNASFLAAGWGGTENGTLSNTLRETKLQKMSCPGQYGDPIDDTRLCTNGYRNDICAGDSGGPLIRESYYYDKWVYVQYGIVSRGSHPGCQRGASFYSKVAYYIPWIIEKLARE